MADLSFSPNIRLRMTLAREMDLDPNGEVFSDDLYSRYLAMLGTANARQEGLIRSLTFTDVGLAILLMGKSITIPVLNIGLSELPAAREALSILASLGFLFLCLAFHNLQYYTAVVEVFAQKRVSSKEIDPDFVAAAYTYTEWFVKLYRNRMNIWGVDFFLPGRGYRLYYGALAILLTLSILGMVLVHFALIGWAAYGTALNGWAFVLYITVMIAINLTGIMVAVTPSFEFNLPNGEAPDVD